MKIVRKLNTAGAPAVEEAKVAPTEEAKADDTVIEVHGAEQAESAPVEEKKVAEEAKTEAKEVAEAPKAEATTVAEAPKAAAAPEKKKTKTVVADALAAKANKPIIKKVWDEAETDEEFSKALAADIEEGAADVVQMFKKVFEARLDALKNEESFIWCGIKFTKTRVAAKFNSFNRPNQLVYYTTAYEMIDAKRNSERVTISAVGDKANKQLRPPFCVKNEKDEWIPYNGDLVKEASEAYPDFVDRSIAVNQKNLADASRRVGK